MEELTIDLTYGTALFEAARETGKTELINEEAGQLLEISGKNRICRNLYAHRGFPLRKRKKFLKMSSEGKSAMNC